ncbi:hypothetical protein Acsp01_02030 [Actinoplanes sp. NBRC 101535]|nr:hypothetical protein Acsp01_02030 [Actinoplanes sp. NBRC 101535]
MPDDDARNGLRVGGWIPPYSPDGEGPHRSARPNERAGLYAAPRTRLTGVRRLGDQPPRARLILAAALALGCAACAAVAVMFNRDNGEVRSQAPVAAATSLPGSAAFTPQVPVSVRPSYTPTTVPAPLNPVANPAGEVNQENTTTPPAATGAPTSKSAKPTTAAPAKPAAPSLKVGATVGLESVDQPGYRVRHRNNLGRLDSVNASSSAADRADTRFTVRKGRADDNCVSLESVNFPGYFLRHRDYKIRLERIDGSELFDKDATFCTVTIRDGSALALRSVNYPSYHVVAHRGSLYITDTDAKQATAFLPRSPL